MTKEVTKYVVKYEVDDLETGEYSCQYQVDGTYVEETSIPAEYVAEVTSQLTDLLYEHKYDVTNEDFTVIIDGNGEVTVVPVKPSEEDKKGEDSDNNDGGSGRKHHHHSGGGSTTANNNATVIAEIPVDTSTTEVVTPVETSEESSDDVESMIPKTGDSEALPVEVAYASVVGATAALAVAYASRKKKRS